MHVFGYAFAWVESQCGDQGSMSLDRPKYRLRVDVWIGDLCIGAGLVMESRENRQKLDSQPIIMYIYTHKSVIQKMNQLCLFLSMSLDRHRLRVDVWIGDLCIGADLVMG
jgi:hypothetical protein